MLSYGGPWTCRRGASSVESFYFCCKEKVHVSSWGKSGTEDEGWVVSEDAGGRGAGGLGCTRRARCFPCPVCGGASPRLLASGSGRTPPCRCVRVGVLDRAPPADVPSAQRRPRSTSPRHCSRQAGHSLRGVPGTVTGRAASLTHPFDARSTPECPQMSPYVAQCLLEAESVLGGPSGLGHCIESHPWSKHGGAWDSPVSLKNSQAGSH